MFRADPEFSLSQKRPKFTANHKKVMVRICYKHEIYLYL